MRIFLIASLLLCICTAQAQITFEKTFGTTAFEEAVSVRQTADGGYLLGGTNLVKTDAFGAVEWSNPIPSNYANLTDDGAYILVDDDGQTITFTKVSATGATVWQTTFSEGIWANEGQYIEQIADGGYIVAGRYQNVVGSGMLLLRLDDQGNKVWRRAFSEPTSAGFNDGFSVQQTDDMGFIIAGRTNINYYDSTRHQEVFIIKTDTNGVAEWQQFFGGLQDDAAFSVRQINDGSYFVGGVTNSFGGGFGNNMYLMKLDALGDSLWTKTYGGIYEESATTLWATTDGGCILAGSSNTFSNGDFDAYVVKVDSDGNELWAQNYGGTEIDLIRSIQQTADNGYIMAGYTNSMGAGDFDVYLLKTDSLGEIQSASAQNGPGDGTDNVTIYPNPTNGSFEVLFHSQQNNWQRMELTTIEGRVLEIRLNIGALESLERFQATAAGMYLLHVITANGRSTRQVVVTR